MLEHIIKALKGDARFSGWQVTEVRGRSHQRYAVFGDVETRREVEKHSARVRVFVAQPGETAEGRALMGESSFTLSADTLDVAGELDRAHERARLVKNPAWSLPGPDRGGDVAVATSDPLVVERPAEAAEELEAAIAKAAAAHRGIELASSEVFCDYDRVHLVNHLGLERTREETSLYTEYVLLARGQGDEEVEVYRAPTARRLAELDLEHEIAADVEATFAGLRARLPPTGAVDVVIGSTGVEELFDAFVAHASGAAAFERWSRFKLEQPILSEREGEPLSLWSDATVAGGRASYAFDAVGLPGQKVALIEDGRFVRRQNDQRYACWLDEHATGDMGNLVVASGAKTEAALLTPGERPLLQLLRFSQLSPHPHSGAFSGEIRHGYLVGPDGTRTPLKGGSLSGVVFDAFRRASFSQERAVLGRTHAPRSVRLDRVQVTGD